MPAHIYMLAWLPSAEVAAEVQSFKQTMSLEYGSHEALRRPAHITLVPPFRLEQPKMEKLCTELENFSLRYSSFDMTIDGFGRFEQRQVIFLKTTHDESLKELQDSLSRLLYTTLITALPHEPRAFTPHLTVGYRDLSKSNFERAWVHFGNMNYRRNVRVDAIDLMRHEGSWKSVKVFNLSE